MLSFKIIFNILGHLVGQANSVVHLFRRSPFVMTLLWKRQLKENSNAYTILPYEQIVYTRALTYQSEQSPIEVQENKLKARINLKKHFPFQADISCPDDLRINFDNINEELIYTMSDTYIDHVKDNKITPIRSSVSKFDANGVYLENGKYLNADVVIYCTGYQLSLDYLDRPILDAIKYREEKYKIPIMFYKNTFVPAWETMAFVGHTPGLYFTGYELQAKWVNSVFSGTVSLPNENKMIEFIKDLEMKRDMSEGVQYPYGFYIVMLEQICKELELVPDFKEIEKNDPELYEFMWNDEMLGAYFFSNKQNESYFRDMMKKIREFKGHLYALNANFNDVRQSEVIQQFSKNYKY